MRAVDASGLQGVRIRCEAVLEHGPHHGTQCDCWSDRIDVATGRAVCWVHACRLRAIRADRGPKPNRGVRFVAGAL